MEAFHGKQEIKDKYIARLKAHYEADEIVQGVYWEAGKGCAVGCILHSGNHNAFEQELGIPEFFAHLVDNIFENLSNEDAKELPLQFLEAIPVGADLSKVPSKFLYWLLVDKEHGVVKFADGEGLKAIQAVAGLHKRRLKGDEPTPAAWSAAWSAAWAARAAAANAANAAAAGAARAAAGAADPAANAAAGAAWSAGDAARAAAWSAWSARAAAAGAAAWAAWSARTAAAGAARAAWAARAAAANAARAAQLNKLLELLKQEKQT